MEINKSSRHQKIIGNFGEQLIDGWGMRTKNKEEYERDPNVKHIKIEFYTTNWDWEEQ